MKKIYIRISENRKLILQIIFALLAIALAVYFFRHEEEELGNIKIKLLNARTIWVVSGIVITLLYIFLQAIMYVFSFRCVESRISIWLSIKLFLKRNFISVFLPAGGFASLAFFTRELEENKINKSNIHFASFIYSICGLVTVVIIAIPSLFYLLITHRINDNIFIAFGWLLILIALLVYIFYSLRHHGWISKLVAKFFPDIQLLMEEIRNAKISRKNIALTILISLAIEIVGILHLYIAIRALGLGNHVEAAVIGYVVAVLLLIASPFLRGLGAIELTLTFVLSLYGLKSGAAAASMLLYRFFEFWLPLIFGVFSFISAKKNFILRLLPVTLFFITGIVNIISAITPAIPARLSLISGFLPLNAIHYTNFLVLISGFIILVNTVFLFQGSRNAWILAVFLAVFSIVGHLGKALDYEEAILGAFTLIILIYTQSNYRLRSNPRLGYVGFLSLLSGLVAALIFGVTGFYYLDQKHFGINFSLHDSVISVLRIFFFQSTDYLVPKTRFARFFLDSIYFAGFSALSFLFISLIRPMISHFRQDNDDIILAKSLVNRYGCSSLDYFKTYYDKFYFFSFDKESFISFKIANRYAVALESPVCREEQTMEQILIEFEKFCRQSGYHSAYYRVPLENLPVYHQLGKKSLLIGQEAVLNLESFNLQGQNYKSMRNSLNRSEKEGYKFEIINPPVKAGLLQQLKSLNHDWLSSGKEEVVFSNGVFEADELKNQVLFIVKDRDDQVLAFANMIPDYVPGEATYDLLRKTELAPGVVIDFLLIRMFEYFKTSGMKYANLGLVPMSGIEDGKDFTEKSIRFAYEKIQNFSHYKGLRSFKEKFNPDWLNKYLVYDNNFDLLSLPLALSKVMKP